MFNACSICEWCWSAGQGPFYLWNHKVSIMTVLSPLTCYYKSVQVAWGIRFISKICSVFLPDVAISGPAQSPLCCWKICTLTLPKTEPTLFSSMNNNKCSKGICTWHLGTWVGLEDLRGLFQLLWLRDSNKVLSSDRSCYLLFCGQSYLKQLQYSPHYMDSTYAHQSKTIQLQKMTFSWNFSQQISRKVSVRQLSIPVFHQFICH